MARGRLDPVAVEVGWQKLLAILDEAALTVVRTSFSKVVCEGNDFAILLYDRVGRMVGQDVGVSSKLAPSPLTIRHMLAKYPPETLRPGDVMITNDPWLCCGHLYDISVGTPLFHRGRLVGFAECLAHVPDVGGGLSNACREVFEEGLFMPVVKFMRGGKEVPEVVDLIAANLRVPQQILGDVRAFVSAVLACGEKVSKFLGEKGYPDLQPLADEIIGRSERAVRANIRKLLPPGEYPNTIPVDGFGPDTTVTIRVAVKVRGSDVLVDYTGSSPQNEYGINCTEVYTYAWTAYALKCAVSPEIPNNHGSFSPIRVFAPLGSLLNPRRPAAVRMKSGTGNFIPFAVLGALAPAVPNRVIAQSGVKCIARFYGTTDGGRSVAETHHFMGGLGARPTKDGLPCRAFPASGANTPVELIEHSLPVLVHREELVCDSGGPGQFRGGLGLEVVLEGRARKPLKLLMQNVKVHTPVAGYLGGRPGQSGMNVIDGVRVPGKTDITIARGSTLLFRTPGGGGMFDPHRRDPERVAQDVRDGMVSLASARREYGVVVEPRAGRVDRAATARLRGKVRKRRRG